MKNLLFNLSGISELFNEKRFVYKGPEKPALNETPLGNAENPDKGNDRAQITPGLAAEDTTGRTLSGEEIAREAVRGAKQEGAKANKAAESYAQSGFLKILDDMGKKGGVMEREKGRDKFSALRQQLIDNPKAFKRFEEYSRIATQKLAERGNKLTQAQLNADDETYNNAVFEAQENRNVAIPLIAEAFNENPKTKATFLAAMVDLYIADLAKDNTAKDAAYNRLTADFIKIAPERTLALLPTLKVNRADALFVRNEEKKEK